MIIVAAKVRVKPGKREEFIQAAQDSIAATRKENGNVFYELYASTEDGNLVMYYEQWTGRDVLAVHLDSAHMKAFAKIKEERGLVEGPSEVTVYDLAE